MGFLRRHYPELLLFLWLLASGGCAEREPSRATPQMEAPQKFWIRVLLRSNISDCSLKIPSTFKLISSDAKDNSRRFQKTLSPVKVRLSGGKIFIGALSLTGEEVTATPDKPYIFYFNGSPYRGKLKILLEASGETFQVINEIPLEPYLAGVVGSEMPSYWEPAALEAQAVAARTYCLYTKRRFGSERSWDLRRTQANQVYEGVYAESAQVWAAVNKTFGKVLVCGSEDNSEEIFPAYYSSICGGHTESSKNVFGEYFRSLVGRPCPYCKVVAKPNFFFWPVVSLDKKTVTNRLFDRYPQLRSLEKIIDIVPSGRSRYNNLVRLTMIKLVGSNGKNDYVRAEDFRLAVDPTGRKLRSAAFQIKDGGDKWRFVSGRGFGHAVGMCQCGAQGMARKGKSVREILSYYYPNSKTKSVY